MCHPQLTALRPDTGPTAEAASTTRRPVTVEAVPAFGPALMSAEHLLHAYRRTVRQQYRAEPELADLILDQVRWSDDHGRLLPAYQAPEGALLIGYCGRDPAGCVALRRAPGMDGAGELKRLFVREGFRGAGIARALLQQAEEVARLLGHRRLVLETGDRQSDAIALYRARGFRPIAPYRALPDAVAHRFHSLALDLARA